MQTNNSFVKIIRKHAGEQMKQQPIITVAESEALLVMAATKFRLGLPLRSEIKAFVRRNYNFDDFLNYYVNPVEFDAWLLI